MCGIERDSDGDREREKRRYNNKLEGLNGILMKRTRQREKGEKED